MLAPLQPGRCREVLAAPAAVEVLDDFADGVPGHRRARQHRAQRERLAGDAVHFDLLTVRQEFIYAGQQGFHVQVQAGLVHTHM
jgi:hypothetical protein